MSALIITIRKRNGTTLKTVGKTKIDDSSLHILDI